MTTKSKGIYIEDGPSPFTLATNKRTAERRLGRFLISLEYTCHDWKELLPIMAHMVVIEARWKFDTQEIEYLAYSNLFATIDEATAAPMYQIITTRTEGASDTIRAERI